MTAREDLTKIFTAAIEAAHPLPDKNSIAGARQIKLMLENASGPFVPDNSTFAHALGVLKKHKPTRIILIS